MATVVAGDFEWDDENEAANIAKHGVNFSEAATAFADPMAVFLDDGSGTDRIVVIGASIQERLLVVVHIVRGSRDRIISARRAGAAEQSVYLAAGV